MGTTYLHEVDEPFMSIIPRETHSSKDQDIRLKQEWITSTLEALNQLSGQSGVNLYAASTALLEALHHALHTSTQSMLPTYTTSLPSPDITGTAVAIDLGGSTLRVSVIELQRHPQDEGSHLEPTSDWKVLVWNTWLVGDDIKRLRSEGFFDWIAECVRKTLEEAGLGNGQGESVGVAWSFPVT